MIGFWWELSSRLHILYPYMGENRTREASSLVILIRALISFMGALPLWPHLILITCQRFHLLMPFLIGVRVSKYEFWGGTVQSLAISQTIPDMTWKGQCMRVWIPGGRDHQGLSWRLAPTQANPVLQLVLMSSSLAPGLLEARHPNPLSEALCPSERPLGEIHYFNLWLGRF